MNERRRVDAQPAFVLHSIPFRETSLIVEVFSRDFGRVSLLARGARRPRSAIRGLLMGFQPLEIGWAGRGEVMTLMKAEWQGGQPLLSGKALFCAYYLNELLLNLLPREDAHEALFAVYARTLRAFADGVREADLRHFERSLLQELGYGLTLTHDVEGQAIESDAWYRYEVERGPVHVASRGDDGSGEVTDSAWLVRGRTLLDLAAGTLADAASASQGKQLMRALIHHYLGGETLATRKILRELQEPT